MKKNTILLYNKWAEEDEENIKTGFQESRLSLLVHKFKGEKLWQ
jgi:hypothetical protein